MVTNGYKTLLLLLYMKSWSTEFGLLTRICKKIFASKWKLIGQLTNVNQLEVNSKANTYLHKYPDRSGQYWVDAPSAALPVCVDMSQRTLLFFPHSSQTTDAPHSPFCLWSIFVCLLYAQGRCVAGIYIFTSSEWFSVSWWPPSPVSWDVSASGRFKQVAASFHFWLLDLTELWMAAEFQIFFCFQPELPGLKQTGPLSDIWISTIITRYTSTTWRPSLFN